MFSSDGDAENLKFTGTFGKTWLENENNRAITWYGTLIEARGKSHNSGRGSVRFWLESVTLNLIVDSLH